MDHADIRGLVTALHRSVAGLPLSRLSEIILKVAHLAVSKIPPPPPCAAHRVPDPRNMCADISAGSAASSIRLFERFNNKSHPRATTNSMGPRMRFQNSTDCQPRGLLQMAQTPDMPTLVRTRPQRFRSDIALSTSTAFVPRMKASPGHVTGESTGLLECLRSNK